MLDLEDGGTKILCTVRLFILLKVNWLHPVSVLQYRYSVTPR